MGRTMYFAFHRTVFPAKKALCGAKAEGKIWSRAIIPQGDINRYSIEKDPLRPGQTSFSPRFFFFMFRENDVVNYK